MVMNVSWQKKNILVKTKNKMRSDGLLFMWLISSRSASKAAASKSTASNVLLSEVSNEATSDLNIYWRAKFVLMTCWCNG